MVTAPFMFMGRRAHSLLEKILRDTVRRHAVAPGAAHIHHLISTAHCVGQHALVDHMERLGVDAFSKVLLVRIHDLVHGLRTYRDTAQLVVSLHFELKSYQSSADAVAMADAEMDRREQMMTMH